MSTIAQHPPATTSEGSRWYERVRVPEMWAALAISMMWLAVLFAALFGPDFVSTSGNGSSATRIPSAIVVALFAYLGTRVIAQHGFARGPGNGRP
jgi:hypothetical protein